MKFRVPPKLVGDQVVHSGDGVCRGAAESSPQKEVVKYAFQVVVFRVLSHPSSTLPSVSCGSPESTETQVNDSKIPKVQTV